MVDNATNNGRSDVTVNTTFTTEGDFTVSDLVVSAGNNFIISSDNAVTLYGMSTSAGTLTFGVDNATTHSSLTVTNAAVDLTGATVAINVMGAGLVDGDEFKIADGNATIVGGPGATKTDVTDNSFLWDFQIADGTAATVATDDTELYAFTTQANTVTGSASASNAGIAQVVDGLSGSTNPQIVNFLANLNSAGTQEELNEILSSVTPTVDGGFMVAGLSVSGSGMSIVSQQLAMLRNGEDEGVTGMSAGSAAMGGYRMWAQGFGQLANQDVRDGVAGYDADTYGLAVGVDTENAMENGVIGAVFSYANTEVDSDNFNNSQTDVDSYQLTLYGDYHFDNRTFMNGMLGYVYGDNETTRSNVGGAGGPTAHGDFASHQIVAQVETGRDYAMDGNLTLTPSLLAHYVHFSAEDYRETGAGGLNMNVDTDNVQIFELGLGAKAAWNLTQADGAVLQPSLHAGARYDLIGDDVQSTANFTGGGASFTTQGADPARFSINAGAGIKYQATNNWDFTAAYDFQYKEDFDAHSGMLRAGYKF